MSNPAVINALRVIALAEADEQSPEAWYKSKCRWFSREFHTPLKEVEAYPIEYVLRHYYEDHYWALASGSDEDAQHLNQIIINTLAVDSPTFKEEMAQVEAEDDDWYEQEIAALHAKSLKQDLEIAQKKIKPDSNGILIDKPNLSKDTKTITVNPFDPPVFDDIDEED